MPYGKDYVCILRVVIPIQTEGFPYYSLKTVPFHRTFYFSVNTDPQPVPAEIIFTINKGETISMQTFPLSVYLFKFPALAHQGNLWKRKSLQQDQADKRLRPFARRELKMARPARVSMRARKP
jgi:hypothetical protein